MFYLAPAGSCWQEFFIINSMTQEELITKRNDIAEKLYVNISDCEAKEALGWANDLMEKLYGEDWYKDEISESERGLPVIDESQEPFGYTVNIMEVLDAKYVQVKAMGENFAISCHDAYNGVKQTYNGWQKLLKETGLTTFNYKQGLIITALLEEINACLISIGGNPLNRDWYISNRTTGNEFEVYCLSTFFCCFTLRPIDLEFYCRPILDFKEC